MTNGVKACMRCIGTNMKRLEPALGPEKKNGIIDVALGPSALAYQCGDCDYVGNPVLFISEEDRKKFLEMRNASVKDATRSDPAAPVPVKACMNCGGTSISSFDALKRHSVQKHICNECGYVGACATFASEEARQQHVKQKKNGFR